MATKSSSLEIYINRLHWPVTVLGYGRRAGIWLQGCSIGCPGCCARDTWIREEASRTTVDEVRRWLVQLPLAQVDGITISGGEPFEQPTALNSLLQMIRELPTATGKLRDVLVYSGYSLRKLEKWPHILKLIDALVDGPYLEHIEGGPLKGSGNQVVHLLSELAKERYSICDGVGTRSMQLHFDGRRAWMIGIPRNGDLERLREKLAVRGISLTATSWRE